MPESVPIASMAMKLKILLVDDDQVGRTLVATELRRLGHSVVEKIDGTKTLAAFQEERPDMVVLSLDMPSMDGLQVAREIKNLALPFWQPVLAISGLSNENTMLEALENGADGYFSKRTSPRALDGWMRSIGRVLRMQREAEERSIELSRYYDAEEEEKRLAQYLMERLVNAEKLNDPALRHWVMPTHVMSGDVVAAARTPGSVLYVLLADGTGHGLAASLNVLPIIAPFYRMTEKGFGIGAIARELNNKLRQIMPIDRFVATTLAAIDFREARVQVWNGGNPNTYLVGPNNTIQFVFPSAHLPIGLATEKDFDETLAWHPLTNGCQLILFSDGLTEATDDSGIRFGEEKVAHLLVTQEPENRLNAIKTAVAGHLAEKPAHDDLSLVIVNCDLNEEQLLQQSWRRVVAGHAVGEWSFSLSFGPNELRNVDVVPLMLSTLSNFESAKPHIGVLFSILSELFNNALDHGLLELPSSLKDQPDGLDIYMQERTRRLADLAAGSIEIKIKHRHELSGERLLISCRDTGQGFQYEEVNRETLPANNFSNFTSVLSSPPVPFGRGLVLVRSLCEHLEFLGCGNEVYAVFRL